MVQAKPVLSRMLTRKIHALPLLRRSLLLVPGLLLALGPNLSHPVTGQPLQKTFWASQQPLRFDLPPLLAQAAPGLLSANKPRVSAPTKEISDANSQPLNFNPPPPGTVVAVTPTPIRQGNQVLLNGRSWPISWSQWQAGGNAGLRTGLTDAGLMQALGFQLLDNSDPGQQPIEWFANPGTTASILPTLLTGPLRYLDITDLARERGWQIQVNGGTLQLNLPPARVLAIRQGQQTWGDRIVLDLDRPASWQANLQGQELVVTIDAPLNPTVSQSFQARPGRRLTSIALAASADRTTLRLGLPAGLRPRVWSLPNPNRLLVDVRPDSLVEQNLAWAKGLRWQQRMITVGSDRFPIVWLTIDPRQTGLEVAPILPNPNALAGIAPLVQTARQAQVAAAINGGFFNRNNQFPLGAVRRNGRWLSGPILNRGAIAWDSTGAVRMDRLALQEVISTPTGQRFPLTTLNSAYVQAGIARYTPDWGPTYTPFSANEILVTVQAGQVRGQQSANPNTAIPIPTDGYLLAVRANQAAASALTPGTPLRLESATTPVDFARFTHIIGAGPLLVQNGQVVLNARAEGFSDAFIRETAARSAIGRTAAGTLILVAVHTRVDGPGATLADIARIMQQLGAVDALNLDGGSSTTLFLGGQILDRPPSSAARVHNGIGVFLRP